MRRLLIGVPGIAIGLAMFAVILSPAPSAQSPLRLYVLDGGTLGGKSAVSAYLVVHPRGTLLWEAGTVLDADIESGATRTPEKMPPLVRQFNASATRTLKSQLAAIGTPPAAITYFAASHYHFDHIANARDYRGSTWLVQKADRDAMFAPGAPPFGAEPAYYASLKDAKTRILNGDHDVFGDGSVVIKSTPGHTPGHQCLFVRLARTGPVVLGGDVYHAPAERERPLDTIPQMDTNPELSKVTRPALEAFVKQTGAAFCISHDMGLFSSQKKAPAFYD